MDMCYDGTLVLPSSYAVMDEEEMSYLEGGGTAVVYGTASQIRSRLTAIIGASLVGTGASAALGFLLGMLEVQLYQQYQAVDGLVHIDLVLQKRIIKQKVLSENTGKAENVK